MQGRAGMPTPGQQQAPMPEPKLGSVLAIQSQGHLLKVLNENTAVIVDFWASWCGPCMRFKPTFEALAKENNNPKIVFCAVETDKARDAAQANNVSSIPQFNFYFNGKEHAKFVGANEATFRKHLSELQSMTNSKSAFHSSMNFRQFKPQTRLPVGFTAAGQTDKMKEFIGKLAQENAAEVKVNYLFDWLIKFDIKQVSNETLDQIVGLAEIAEDKSKIALIDLLRLIVLDEQQAEYIFTFHWNLIDICVIGYVEAQDLKDKEAKVMHNYHLACFKLLINIF